MTLTTERQQFAEQNEMSLEFVNWFFDEKKDGCGNAWLIMAAAMWEGWKGRAANREAQPVGYIDPDSLKEYRGQRAGGTWSAVKRTTSGLNMTTPIYTAPPALSVPAEMPLTRAIEIAWKDSDIDSPGSAYRDGWNACRAAMLNHVGDNNEKAAAKCECSSIDYCGDCLRGMMAQPVSSGYTLPDGFKLMPLEMTDEIGEAIAMEARCCGGIALCIYEAALAAAPEGGNG